MEPPRGEGSHIVMSYFCFTTTAFVTFPSFLVIQPVNPLGDAMFSKFNRKNWRPKSAVALIAALSLTATQAAQAATVSLYVLAPKPPETMATLEQHGAVTPWFQRDFSIPYGAVEPLIRNEIKSKVDGTRKGTVVCTDPCPDVDWTVTITSDFSFTQKGQPVVKAFGNPQQNGVDISVHAQMRLKFNIFAKAETWFDSADGNFPVELLIGVDASSRLNLWPSIQSQNFKFDLTLDDSNINLSDLDGEFIEKGAKIGVIIGFTPIGMALGGPAGLGALLALIGAEAAKVAEQKIKAEAENAFNLFLSKIEEQVKTEVGKRIDAAVAQANNVKDKLLNAKLPVVNKSFQELSSAAGLTLDVQTTTPAGNVHVIVTPRFTAAAGSGVLTGKLRIPKEQCIYLKNRIVGVVPVGFSKANEDLAGKVGSSCASVFPASSFKVQGYLGANPAVAPGGGETPLQSWKGVGTVSFTGNLANQTVSPPGQKGLIGKVTGYYECGYQISGLPNADFIELAPSSALAERLTDIYGGKDRYLEVSALGLKLVLDSDWKQTGTGSAGLVIGGVAKCSAGSSGTGQEASWWQTLKDKFDPEKCPQCGIKQNGLILEVSNPDPILNNADIRAALKPLERTNVGNKHVTFTPATVIGSGRQVPIGQKGIETGPIQKNIQKNIQQK